MVEIDRLLEGEPSRRNVLEACAAGGIAGLAGCSGSDSNQSPEETDSATRTEPETENTPNQTQTDSTNDETKYPTQESQNLQKKLDELTERKDGSKPNEREFISLKADIDSLDIDKYPNITEKYRPDSKIDIMQGKGQDTFPLDEALYLASTVGTPDSDTNSIYFIVENPKTREDIVTDDQIAMYINPNEVNASLSDQRYFVSGDPNLNGQMSQSEVVDSHQSFFEESDLTADEIVHAVDLEDTYVEEALQ